MFPEAIMQEAPDANDQQLEDNCFIYRALCCCFFKRHSGSVNDGLVEPTPLPSAVTSNLLGLDFVKDGLVAPPSSPLSVASNASGSKISNVEQESNQIGM